MRFILMHSSPEKKAISAIPVIFMILVMGAMSGCNIVDSARNDECNSWTDCESGQVCVAHQCVQSADVPDLSLSPDLSMAQPDLNTSPDLNESELKDMSASLDQDEAPDLAPAEEMGAPDMEAPRVDMAPPVTLPPPGYRYATSDPFRIVESVMFAGMPYTLATSSDLSTTVPTIRLMGFPSDGSFMQHPYRPSRPFVPTDVLATADGLYMTGYNPETLRLRAARLDTMLDDVWSFSYRGDEIGKPPVKIVQLEEERFALVAIAEGGVDNTLMIHTIGSTGRSISTWNFELVSNDPGINYTLIDTLFHANHAYVLLEAQRRDGVTSFALLDVDLTMPGMPVSALEFEASPTGIHPVQLLALNSPDTFLIVTHQGEDTVLLEFALAQNALMASHILPMHHTSHVTLDRSGNIWSTGSSSAVANEQLEVGYLLQGEFHALLLPGLPTASGEMLLAAGVNPILVMREQSDLLMLPIGPGPSATCQDMSAGTQRVAVAQSSPSLEIRPLHVFTQPQGELNTLEIELFPTAPAMQTSGEPLTQHCAN